MNNNCNLKTLLGKYRVCLMGVAILFIMFTHNSIQIGQKWHICKELAQAGVDMFFFLSGYGLCNSFMKNPHGFYKRRFLRIIPDYLIIIIPYVVFLILFTSASISSVLWRFSLISFYTDGILQEWFIAAILILYLIYPLVYRISRSRSLFFITSAAIWAIVIFAIYGPVSLPYNIFIVLGAFVVRIPVFIAGSYLKQLEQKGITYNAAINIIVLILSIVLNIFIQCRMDRYGTFMRLLFFPLAISLCIVLSLLFNALPVFFRIPFEHLGAITLVVYLTHEKILGIMSAVCLKITGMDISKNLRWNIVINILAVLFCLTFSSLYVRTKEYLKERFRK